ncbi:carboxypeptidase-like regulatory domain-containing protein [Flavobacterium wongokense]|uniref:carboxypeptidase-like regulatory domain-containing protein n=1 Tax=Flavobacterium wongokense TaxID=2910674 RepID=UPI001F2351D3|nr:carboxypeptidase-like regulatory domain-containing protein [Flavobacterium sp. WG47]MCF6131455.1 carboxypeptidase-like regulatory domain-containing protein [Flavobacterium sp. WG47]
MKPLICILLIAFSASAQISGTIVNEKGNAIPYVNIWIENENIGTTSDENGIFKINAEVGKTAIFSSVGFEIKKTALTANEKVILKEAVYKLDEVVISKRKQDRQIEIGDAHKIHHTMLSGDKPWIYGKLFEYDSAYAATPYLNKIIFYTDSEKKDAKLKIRLFEFNGIEPADDMLQEDLVVTVKKGMRKNEIDVSKYNLKFPEKGIVIGLEWMVIEENKYNFEYKDKTKGLVKTAYYAPSLVINYSDSENSLMYSKGRWTRSRLILKITKEKNPWDNKVMTPAINLILTN